MATAAEMAKSESLPAMAPANAWAPSLPLYAPSMFWVNVACMVMSPVAVYVLPWVLSAAYGLPISTVAVFLFTLTATPTPIALPPLSRLTAAPVPMVLKLPWLIAETSMLPADMFPYIKAEALWFVMFTATAAATLILLCCPPSELGWALVVVPSLFVALSEIASCALCVPGWFSVLVSRAFKALVESGALFVVSAGSLPSVSEFALVSSLSLMAVAVWLFALLPAFSSVPV